MNKERRKKNKELSQFKQDYNVLHGWFRATVEHANAQIKQFNILGNRYRGMLKKDELFLRDAVAIVCGIVCLQMEKNPHRHVDIDVPFPVKLLIKDQLTISQNTFEKKGRVCGQGPEPDDRIVDTQNTIESFVVGEQVLAWWWGGWYLCKIHYIAKKTKTVALRWEDNTVTYGYKARLVKKRV